MHPYVMLNRNILKVYTTIEVRGGIHSRRARCEEYSKANVIEREDDLTRLSRHLVCHNQQAVVVRSEEYRHSLDDR